MKLRRFALCALLILFASSVPAIAATVLLNAVTTTGTGAVNYLGRNPGNANRTYQATVSGTGAVSATVLVLASDDGVGWVTLGTITLSGTGTASDGFAALAPWMEVEGDVTAISGTGAAVTLTVGAQ